MTHAIISLMCWTLDFVVTCCMQICNKFIKTKTIFEISTVVTIVEICNDCCAQNVVLGKKAKQTKKYNNVATSVKCLNFWH